MVCGKVRQNDGRRMGRMLCAMKSIGFFSSCHCRHRPAPRGRSRRRRGRRVRRRLGFSRPRGARQIRGERHGRNVLFLGEVGTLALSDLSGHRVAFASEGREAVDTRNWWVAAVVMAIRTIELCDWSSTRDRSGGPDHAGQACCGRRLGASALDELSALPGLDGLHRESERQDLFTKHRIGQGTDATAVRWLSQNIA